MLARKIGQSREFFIQLSKQMWLASTHSHSRCLCTSASKTPMANNSSKKDAAMDTYTDKYNKLQNMDFWTSAKMIFSDPPRKKKFGFDFHLVQFVFACMPPLAVYLVAQYARYEMRKMEADMEEKKKSEEAKAKAKAAEEKEKEAANDPRILEVNARLDKLEETLKEIVISSRIEQKDGEKGKNPAVTDSKSAETSPEASRSTAKDSSRKDTNGGAPQISNALQKSQTQAK